MDPLIVGIFVLVSGVAGIASITAWRKRGAAGELARSLGSAYRVIEASTARIEVATKRGARAFTAKASMAPGHTTWFVVSPRPLTKSPWEVGVRNSEELQHCRDDLERTMARMRVISVEMVAGAITVAVLRATKGVDIVEVFDAAAEISAIIDRVMPSAVSLALDADLFAQEAPSQAVGGTSGAPFGIGTGGDR